MPSSWLLKGDGNRSAHSSRTMRIVAQRASRLVTGRQHCPSEGVQPVTERRHGRIRTASGIEHGDVSGLQTLASSADLEAASQPGLDQRRSVMHLAHRVVEPDQPGLGPGADGGVWLDRQGEHALHPVSGWHRERARGAKDLGGIAVVAIEIELAVDHTAAGESAGVGRSQISPSIQRLTAIADNHQIAGVGVLERQPGALEPGARPVLSFINQYGVVAPTQARVASQSSKQALAEGAILLALLEIDAAADGTDEEGRHRTRA